VSILNTRTIVIFFPQQELTIYLYIYISDRIEPRVLKRRRHHYPLLQRPRAALRAELTKT